MSGQELSYEQTVERMRRRYTNEDAVALLRAHRTGVPPERLSPLLQSADPSMAKAAAWIASELGEHAAPLIPELIPLLEHDSRYVRFFAVDTVLSAAGLEHGAAIGTAISRLLVDSDDAVRWKLLNLLARASDEQLEVAVPYIDDPPLASAVSWLSDPNIDTAQRMMHGTPLDRIIGTAGAVRLGEEGLPLLREISHSCDIELSSFASEMLRQRT